MAELSFRQRAAQEAAIQLRQTVAHTEAREPFSFVIGTVSISLRACVGKPCYIGADSVERRTADDKIVIVLAMSNQQGAQPMRYEAWGDAAGAASDSRQAVLSDDAGNRYSTTPTGRGLDRWSGQITGSRTLSAGQMLSDVLIFGPPHHKATRFTLVLPRLNFGLAGVMRVELPAGRITNFHRPTN